MKKCLNALLLVIICLTLFTGCNVNRSIIYVKAKGPGMSPTIKKGSTFKVNLACKCFERGDIVLFRAEGSETYFQRIIALPNEKVEIKRNTKGEGIVTINGKVLDEPYRRTLIETSPHKKAIHFGPFVVPENSYFLLGDERDLAYDSRFWGAIEVDNIRGIVVIPKDEKE